MAGSQRRPWRLVRPETPGNHHAFKDSLWNDPTEPSCAICGQLILADPNPRTFFSEVDNFNAASGNRDYIKLTVPDMHEFLAAGRCDWRSTYRAVVKLHDRPEPFITGVSYRHSGFGRRKGYCIGASVGENDAWLIKGAIHPPGEIAWFARCAIHSTDPKPANVGWPIHECCYHLLMRCYEDKGLGNHIPTLMFALLWEYHTKRQDYRNYGEPPEDSGAKEMVQHDPLFITTYYEAIQTAINRYQESDQNPEYDPNYGYKGVMTQGGFYISPGAFSRLPLDLGLMILDYCDGREFRNLILAAQWKIPSIYWKRAIPRCVFELHDDLQETPLDWQYLGLEFHRIMERKDGLWHRLSIAHYMARIWAYYSREEVEIIKDRFLGVA